MHHQTTLNLLPEFSDTWANECGRDSYGLRASVIIAGATQTFRWIPAGTFLMGSPDSELGRNPDEILHAVTLTHGFWLADTPVTQALWEAVMGNNPSRFRGNARPVENVSWDDAKTFIHKINTLQPNLNLCLPTEAQWEYACRAGTTTPFHMGNNLSTEAANYHGYYPYQGSGVSWGKRYRGKTTDVWHFPPNHWGLYGMHGNVWEWCYDWYGAYKTRNGWQSLQDPHGSRTGAYRVLRGGAWCSSAADCRSACRDPTLPNFGIGDFGFRLSRCSEQQTEC